MGMTGVPILYWWLIGIGGGLAIAASVLLVMFIRGDRSRGRPRCPRCWYSMVGAMGVDGVGEPATKCPECAHETGVRAELFRTRRPWPRLLSGVGLLALAAAITYPVWQDDARVARALPDWALVRIAPITPPRSAGLASALHSELGRRIKLGALAQPQILHVVHRYFDGTGGQPLVEIRPISWDGAPCMLAVQPPRMFETDLWVGDLNLSVRARLASTLGRGPGRWIHESDYFLVSAADAVSGVPPAGDSVPIDLEVEFMEKAFWSSTIQKPQQRLPSADRVLSPRTVELWACVGTLPRLYVGTSGDDRVAVMIPSPRYTLVDRNLAFGAVVEVLHEGRVMATGTFVPKLRWGGGFCGNEVAIPEHIGLAWFAEPPPEIGEQDRWSIRLTGSRELALHDFDSSGYVRKPPPTTCWDGVYEVPITGYVDAWNPE